jgi:gluconolactonase
MRRVAAIALALGLAGSAAAAPGFERYDARLDRLVAADARAEKIAAGFAWVEGPVWDRAGAALLFTDIPNNAVYRWRAGEGTRLFLKPSGYTGSEPFAGREPGANGLAFDGGGRLVLAEHGDRRIARLEADGSKTTLARDYQGRRLNSPNDLAFRSNGDLYFTDPPFGLPRSFDDAAKELPFSGVYRLSRDGVLTLLTAEIGAPNGIAFSPDEKTLYLTDVDPQRPRWLAYEVEADGTLGAAREFADAARWNDSRSGGPDGLKLDREGNLFAAGPGGLYVFAPDGTLLGFLDLGVATSNCAWGDDGSVLFVTADTAVYRLQTLTRGAGF